MTTTINDYMNAQASATLYQYRLVALDSSSGDDVNLAGVASDILGTVITTTAYATSGSEVSIKLWSPDKTHECIADGAISEGADVYAGASGKISATQSSGKAIGRALQAATADGDVIEVLPYAANNTNAQRKQVLSLQDFKKNTLLELAASPGSSLLALVAGTHGTNSPVIRGSDVSGTTATEVARMTLPVPTDYAGGDLTFVFFAGMQTTVSDGTATLDLQVYKTINTGSVSSDLCETDAQSINSTTKANKSFTVDGDNLSAGDMLDIEITVSATDTGHSGAGIAGEIAQAYFNYYAK